MRPSASILLSISLLVLAACGGGGGSAGSSSSSNSSSSSSSSGGGTTAPHVTIALSTNAPLIATGESPRLFWSTSGTACTASGGWSGSKETSGVEVAAPVLQTTTYSLTCTAANAQSATASVMVMPTGPLAPAATASKVWSVANVTSLDYVRIPYGIRSMVWSETHGLLYGITRPESTTAPNSLVAIDPATQATQVLPLGGEAFVVDITSNDEFLYVGMSVGGSVKRIRTADFTLDLDIPVGGATTGIFRVVPSPVDPHTIAVLANRVLDPDDAMGLFIYDDATPRPASLAGSEYRLIDVDWNADGTQVYVMNNGSDYGFYDVEVDAEGAHRVRIRDWPTASPGTVVGNRYFSFDGRVFNITGPVNLEARIPDHYFASPFQLPAPERGKVFSIGTNLRGQFEDGSRIMAFDIDTYTYIDAVVFHDAADFRGAPLFTWGDDGLFIAGVNESIVARGSFAAAGGMPPAWTGALPVRASGTVSSPTAGTINYRVVDLAARAATANPCGQLFVSTTMTSWAHPGSVLEINPDDMTITRSARAGSEPYLLTASDDCSTLYVGSQFTSSVARVRTSDLTTTDVLPLGGETLSRARSMSVAPGQAQTVAISLGEIEWSRCSGTDQGVVIYDGTTARPTYDTDGMFGIKSVAFGANPSVLYGEDHTGTYAFDADSNGIGNPRLLIPPGWMVDHADDLGRSLYFDPAANRVYNLRGDAYDAASNTLLPKISLAHTATVSPGCGTPRNSRATDRTTGKLFWISDGPTQGSLGFSVYARNGLTRLGAFDLVSPGASDGFGWFGIPADLSRLSNNRLAFTTDYGYLVILEGAALAP